MIDEAQILLLVLSGSVLVMFLASIVIGTFILSYYAKTEQMNKKGNKND